MQKNINTNISLVRILATCGVVLLHTCCTIFYNPEIFSFTNYQESYLRLIQQLLLWTVPVFFMITGYLLLGTDREITYDTVLRKYVLRIILALLVFGVPFSAIKIWSETHSFSIFGLFKAFLGNGSLSHLWYLYALIGLYLTLPFVKIAAKNVSKDNYFLFLVSFFTIAFLLPSIGFALEFPIAFEMPLKYPFFYFVTGGFIKNHTSGLKNKTWGKIAFCCIIAVISLHLCGIDKEFSDSYWAPITVLYSISVFCFFIERKEKPLSEQKILALWKLDRLCFAVYLIHPIFIQFTYRKLGYTPMIFSNFFEISTLVLFSIFLLLSFTFSYILNSIPIFRKHIL